MLDIQSLRYDHFDFLLIYIPTLCLSVPLGVFWWLQYLRDRNHLSVVIRRHGSKGSRGSRDQFAPDYFGTYTIGEGAL